MSTAVSPSRQGPSARPPRPSTDYAQLLRIVQQSGLMKRRYGYYSIKMG